MRMADIISIMYTFFTNCTLCHDIAPPCISLSLPNYKLTTNVFYQIHFSNARKNYKKMKYIYKFKKNGYNTNSYKMSVSMSTRLLTDKNWRSEYEGTDGYPIWKDFNR